MTLIIIMMMIIYGMFMDNQNTWVCDATLPLPLPALESDWVQWECYWRSLFHVVQDYNPPILTGLCMIPKLPTYLMDRADGLSGCLSWAEDTVSICEKIIIHKEVNKYMLLAHTHINNRQTFSGTETCWNSLNNFCCSLMTVWCVYSFTLYMEAKYSENYTKQTLWLFF